MEILTVNRDWKNAYNQTSILTDSEGNVKMIISSSLKQSQRRDKIIVVGGKEYALEFAAKNIKTVKKDEHRKQ